MSLRLWRGCALLVVLCWSSLLFAQEDAGRLRGRVSKTGQGVGGVAVLVNETKQVEITDADGRFDFNALPAGRYTLIFTRGDNSDSRENVFVTAGATRDLEVEVDWDLGLVESLVVTAAAEIAAKIVDAPAAVTSIPEKQIEREAAHGQLPKVLEFTPGAEVTQSGLYDFNFNTRGFNSSLNRRVSTYIDGRDVGVVLLGAQEWAAMSVPLDDLASLEFIRGPSAALYGANASSGVINMTTKAPRDTLGGFARVTTGQLDTLTTEVRLAQALTDGWYYKITGGFRNSGDFSVSRDPDVIAQPEYSVFCMRVGNTNCLPQEKSLLIEQDDEIRFGTFRLDKYLNSGGVLTFELATGNIGGPVFQTGIGRVQILNAERPYGRFAFSKGRWNVLAHYAERHGNQVNLNKNLRIKDELISDTSRFGIEGQGNWNFGGGRGRFVLGAAFTEEKVDTENPLTGEQTVVFEPIETDREAVFSQLDWKLNDTFKLVFAGRVDKNTLHDTQFSPKAALVYTINDAQSMRLTYNRAFQVANYSEFFLHARLSEFPLLGFQRAICEVPFPGNPVDCGITEDPPILAVGNDDLKLEKTEAWEVGYSGVIRGHAFVTVDYYTSKNKDFITDLIPQQGTSLGNPVNADYLPWVSTPEAETTLLGNPADNITVAQALRNAVTTVGATGGEPLGFYLAQDIDAAGTTVVVARTYANVGDVDTQGVDFGLQYFFNNQWRLQANYSWFDFKIAEDAQDVEDVLLPNTPTHKASLSFSFTRGRWDVSASARWVDDFSWSAGIFQGPVEAYTTADLAASVTLGEHFRVGVTAANVSDNVHRQTFGGDLLSRRVLTYVDYDW